MQPLPPPAPRRPVISKALKADICISCISVVPASLEGRAGDTEYLNFNVSVTTRPGAVLTDHSPSYRLFAYESSGRAVGQAQVGASLFAGLRVQLSDVPQHGGLFVALYCENQLQDAVPVLAAPAAAVHELQRRFEQRVQEQQALQVERGSAQSSTAVTAAGHAAGNIEKEVWQQEFRGLMTDLGFVLNAYTAQPGTTIASDSSSSLGASLLSRVRLSAVAAAAAPEGVPLPNALHPEPATVPAVAERLLHALQMHECGTTRQLVINHLALLQISWPAGAASDSAMPPQASRQQHNQPQNLSMGMNLEVSRAQQARVVPLFRTAAAQTISSSASAATMLPLGHAGSSRLAVAPAAAPAGADSDPASSSSSSNATAGLPAGFNAADMVMQLLGGGGAAGTGGWSTSSSDDDDDLYGAAGKQQHTPAGAAAPARQHDTQPPATPPSAPLPALQPGAAAGAQRLPASTTPGGFTTPQAVQPAAAAGSQAAAAGRQHSAGAGPEQGGHGSSRQGRAPSPSPATAGPARGPQSSWQGICSSGASSSTAGSQLCADATTSSTAARKARSSGTTAHTSNPSSVAEPHAPSSSATAVPPIITASAQAAAADMLPIQLEEGAGPVPFLLAGASGLVCLLLMPSTQELLQQEWLKLAESAAAGGVRWQWLLQLGVPLQLLEASDPGLLLWLAAVVPLTLVLGVALGCGLAARQQQ